MRVVVGAALLVRLFGPILVPRFRGEQVHPWPIPGRTVFVGDAEYLVRESGPPQAPPVVLIHGLAGSSLAEWYRVGPMLAREHRVVLLDNRGHGLSPQTPSRYEIDEAADELADVLSVLGVADAIVVGYSLGGTIAQALVHRHQDLVRRLVLVATFAVHPPVQRALRVAGLLLTRAWERLTGSGTPDVRSAYLLGTRAVDPRHGRWLWNETHRRDPDAGAQAAFAMLRFDSRPWIGEIDVPTTVVIPGQDQLVPPRWQHAMAAVIPGARVVEIADGRHEVPWTHPEQVADIIAED